MKSMIQTLSTKSLKTVKGGDAPPNFFIVKQEPVKGICLTKQYSFIVVSEPDKH